jgi:uncharacterized membrane protein YjfL (UPF0719 family)
VRNPLGSRTIAAGIAGIVLGGLAEMLVNHIAGTELISDGIMWGAVMAVVIVSLPSFTRMGVLTVRSDRPIVNFVVGVGMFLLISLIVVVLFYFAFLLLGRLLS